MRLGNHRPEVMLRAAFCQLLVQGQFQPKALLFGADMDVVDVVDLSFEGAAQRDQKLQQLSHTAGTKRATAVGIFSVEKLRQKDGQTAEYLVMLCMGQETFPETIGVKLSRNSKGELLAPADPVALRVNQKLLPPAWWEASA